MAPLRALQARGGAVVGDAYARAAAAVEAQQERIQDEAAVRSYQRRAARRSGIGIARSLPASPLSSPPAE
jgi:hypothetical protein